MEACQSSIIIKCSSKGPIIRGKKKQEGDNKEDLRWTTKITIMKTTMRTKWTMKNNNNDEENKQKCQRNPGWYIEGRKSRDTVPLRRKSAGSYIYKNVISRIGSVHFTCLYNLFVEVRGIPSRSRWMFMLIYYSGFTISRILYNIQYTHTWNPPPSLLHSNLFSLSS